MSAEPSAPPPRDYLLADLRRLMVRLAANERWYEQSWLGVPIWQLPDDLIRLQEVVSQVRPRWIVETGTKFGGSAIFFASLLEMLGHDGEGGVITVDIMLTDTARETFKSHRLRHHVRLSLEADAAAPSTVARIGERIAAAPGPTLVFLDDDHNADHVLAEMRGYAPLVTDDSYLIVADTVFADLAGTPVGLPTAKYPDVGASNPRVAVRQFLAEDDRFEVDPRFAAKGIGNFPDGFLRRRR